MHLEDLSLAAGQRPVVLSHAVTALLLFRGPQFAGTLGEETIMPSMVDVHVALPAKGDTKAAVVALR